MASDIGASRQLCGDRLDGRGSFDVAGIDPGRDSADTVQDGRVIPTADVAGDRGRAVRMKTPESGRNRTGRLLSQNKGVMAFDSHLSPFPRRGSVGQARQEVGASCRSARWTNTKLALAIGPTFLIIKKHEQVNI